MINANRFKIVDTVAMRRGCLALAASAALGGFSLGLLSGHTAWAGRDEPLRASLFQIGQHLCKEWQGVKRIGRQDATHYSFECNEEVVFPKMEVHLARNP